MKFLTLSLAFCMMFAFAGCSDRGDETNPRYRKAMELRDSGDYPGAARELRRFLGSHPDSAQGCVALGNLYSEYLKDYPAAVHYYQEALRLDPGASNSDTVRSYLASVRKTFTEEALRESAELRRLTEEIEQFRDVNTRLKRTMFTMQQRYEAAARPAARPAAPATRSATPAARPATPARSGSGR